MKSLQTLAAREKALPIAADEVTELHAARMLLLLKLCGSKGRIEGLTKLAKLDFFCRYPEFFKRAAAAIETEVKAMIDVNESPMIRHNYGPWDQRYYQLLPYLEARGLISVTQQGTGYSFSLTSKGTTLAEGLAQELPFQKLRDHMQEVKKAFGQKNGSQLKKLIYKLFPDEVARRPRGEVIE
jgi:hypothetical protein